jgi:sigma-B regulation protein RsbU (phosphoserine phosphatase)
LNAIDKHGNEFPIEIAVSPLQVQQRWWATAIIRDVSQRLQTEKTLREQEIQLLAAQRMQKHLLPDRPPLVPGFDIAGATYPAEFAAGDHFDYLSMPAGCVGVVVSDVSGHGFAPALLVASTQTLLRTLADTRSDVSQILTEANAFLANETEDERFVTVILGGIDPVSRTFTYASAGHPTGYVLRKSGEVKAELKSTSLPLAVFPDTLIPQAEPVQLEPGETIVLLTDGVIEARSANEQSFGRRRALDIIRAHHDRSSRETIDCLYRAICEFTGSERLWDDVTAVIVKVASRR